MPPPKGKSLMGVWIALGAVALLLFAGVVGAVVYFVVFSKPAPHLARYCPKSTSLYFEMPSPKKSILSASKMKPLDESRVDEKKMMDETIGSFAGAFTMSREAAKEVVDGIDAMAFAARDTNGSGKAVGIISFSNPAAAEKLLRSVRFSDEGPYGGSGGKKYKLERRPSASVPAGTNLFEMGLSDMAMTSSKDTLVWFPKAKLLVFGDDPMVTDVDRVIAGGSDSLEQNDAYKTAKRNFESGSDMAFFFDLHDLDDTKGTTSQKLLDSYLKGRQPVTGAVKIVRAGIMMDMHGTLSGSAMPPDDLAPKAAKLSFPHKLPADTVAYMAMSMKTKMTAAAIRSMWIERMGDSDPAMAKAFKDSLDSMERSMGFSFLDIVDMVGDEIAFGILLDPTFKLDTTNGITDELNNFGMVYAIATKDDAKARMILSKIRTKLEDPTLAPILKVRALGTDGFEVDWQTTAAYPIPNLTVKYDGKQVIAVLANGSLTTRAFDALQKGKGTLGDEKAHELAFGALPQDANYYMWLDTGRITSVMMDGMSHVKKGAMTSMLPLDAIRLTGPDRVTSALAVRATPKNGNWAFDMDSLNLPATSLFSVATQLDVSSAMPSGPIFGK